MADPIKHYLNTVEQSLQTGLATEHTHRAALASLIESKLSGITAINEPKRIACGAPDLTILKDDFILGYVEAKDIGSRWTRPNRPTSCNGIGLPWTT